MGQKTEHLVQTGTMETAMFVRLPSLIRIWYIGVQFPLIVE
jgi:hypothetical protein